MATKVISKIHSSETTLTKQSNPVTLSVQNRTQYPQSPTTTLKSKVFHGGLWFFSYKIVEQLLGILRLTILARLLAPSDFGTFGIALLAVSSLKAFSQTGINVMLIQQKDDIKPYLNTAWTVQIFRTLGIALLLVTGSHYWAAFFNAPEVASILQIIGLSILFEGFTNIGIVYFQKDLAFKRQVIYMISGSFVEISITIVLAFFFLRNVWALVFGLLGGNFVRMALSYCVHPYRPRISFNFHHFVKIFSFGKWIFTSTVLFFLLKNGDNTFVGKMLGIASLGFYQIAYRLANMPTEQITNVLSPIIFPAYSKLQDNLPRLRQAYLNSLQLIAFIAIPMAAGIFILAPEFTKIFLGEKWMPVVQPMRVLCIAGAIRAIAATSGPIFLALGRPDINTRLAFAQLISIAILIYPLTSMWGIIGTALSISITGCLFIFAILISLIRLTKMRNSDISHLIKNILFPLIAIAPVMGIKTIFITPFMNNANLILITVIAIGIITYLINTYLLDKCMNYNILIKIKACSELLNFKKVF